MRRLWTSLPVLLVLLTLSPFLFFPPAARCQAPGDVEEEITVWEVGLVLDFEGLPRRDIRRLDPRDILVRESGTPQEVLSMSSLHPDDGAEWHSMVYFDGALSKPETVRDAALLLAQRSTVLAGLGSVRVVVAEEQPQEALRATGSALDIEEALLQVAESGLGADRLTALRDDFAAQMEADREGTSARGVEFLERELALIRERTDHLLRLAGEGCPGSACVLILVSDGFFMNPEVFYLGEAWARARAQEQVSDARHAAAELARTLASYEWSTLVAPLRIREDDPEIDVTSAPGSDFDRWRDATASANPDAPGSFQGVEVKTGKRRESTLEPLPVENYDVFLMPVFAPLRLLADESAGATLRIAPQLDQALELLPRRWRLWYRTTRPLDGELRPVEVRLVRNGRSVRTPSWVRAGTPDSVAAARLRGFLEGISERGELAVTGRLADEGTTLEIDVNWSETVTPPISRRVPVRISVAHRQDRYPIFVEHHVLELEPDEMKGEQSLRQAVSVPDGTERVALYVENLLDRVWGATLVAGPSD